MKKNLINNFQTSGYQFDENDLDFEKVRILNWYGLIGSTILFVYAFTNILVFDWFAVVLEVSLGGLIIFGTVWLRETKDLRVPTFIGALTIYLMSLNNFVLGGFEGTGHILIFIFPAIIFFLQGKNVGLVWTTILIFSLAFFHIIGREDYIDVYYTDDFFVFMIIVGIAIVSSMIFVYQGLSEGKTQRIKSLAKEIEIANKQLEENIKKITYEKQVTEKQYKNIKEEVSLLEETRTAMTNLMEDLQDERDTSELQKKDLEKFQEAVENASDHIVITDADGHVLYANPAVETTTGFKIHEIIGNTPALWGKQMPQEFYEKFWKTIKNDKKEYTGVITNKRKSGEKYFADVRVAPILDENKNVKFFVGTERDITKEKEIEESKTEFVSIASHQLRTPLTGIKWIIELLLNEDQDNLTKTQKENLNNLYSSAKRMTNLVNDLLNVSRIETGSDKFAMKPQNTDIIQVIDSSVEDQKIVAEHASISLQKSNNFPKKLKLFIDGEKIYEVLQNLLNNAIKYTNKGGKIFVDYSENSKFHIFSVKDNGIGIPVSEQTKIFKKFFRGKNVIKMQTEGTGLGLFVAKSIVEAHGGEIWFESELKVGTTFYFSIPKKPFLKQNKKDSQQESSLQLFTSEPKKQSQ